MRIIKTLAFLLQFSLLGLAIAILYLFWQSEHSNKDIMNFLLPSTKEIQSRSTNQLLIQVPTASYADAVASSFESVVTIYTSKMIVEQSHPLLDDPIFSQLFGEQLQQKPTSAQASSSAMRATS
jgi:serine protease DegS